MTPIYYPLIIAGFYLLFWGLDVGYKRVSKLVVGGKRALSGRYALNENIRPAVSSETLSPKIRKPSKLEKFKLYYERQDYELNLISGKVKF